MDNQQQKMHLLIRFYSSQKFKPLRLLCNHIALFGALFIFATAASASAQPQQNTTANAQPQQAVAPSNGTPPTATPVHPKPPAQTTTATSTAVTTASNQPQYCPQANQLTKQDLRWVVGTNWNSYSESFTNAVSSFIGAQWVGIKVGKIICLYQGEGGVDFPISLEQVTSKIIFEPSGLQWSALVNNRKFCQSTNVFDCPFFVQPVEETKHLYDTIEYQPPQTQNPNTNSDF